MRWQYGIEIRLQALKTTGFRLGGNPVFFVAGSDIKHFQHRVNHLQEWVGRIGKLGGVLQSQGLYPFPSRFSLFALLFFRRLFKKASLFDLPKKTFPLELAFKDFERFFEIIAVDPNNQSALSPLMRPCGPLCHLVRGWSELNFIKL